MATRSYRTWDTSSYTNYVPSYTYRRSEQPAYYNPYSSYRSYYRSNRSLEDSGTRSRTGGSKFDFVTGRYSNDNRHTNLRDADEPTYYQELTDLYLTTNRLQQDYRDILERYSADRRHRGSGSGLPQGYGPPLYSNPDRVPASQRYGLYERSPRYGNRHYETELTEYEPYVPRHYDRASREDYQGSVGNVLYNKELHKGSCNVNDTGPLTKEELELRERGPRGRGTDREGYEREGYEREGSRDYRDNRGPYSPYSQRDRDGRDPYNRDYDGRDPYNRDYDGRDPNNRNYDGRDPNDRNYDGRDPNNRNYDGRDPNNRNYDGRDPYNRDYDGRDPNSRNYDGRDPKNRDDDDGCDPYGNEIRKPDDDFDRDLDYLDTGDNNREHSPSDKITGEVGRGGGGGLKKSPSKANVESLSRERGMKGDSSLPPLQDEFESDSDLELENDMSCRFDSGIDSPDDDVLPMMEEEDFLDTLEEEVDIYIPEPTPEILVYNDISAEEFEEMKEHRIKDEEKEEKPMFEESLTVSVETQRLKIDKVVGEFKRQEDPETPVTLSPLPGTTSCYVTSPIPPLGVTGDLETTDPLAAQPVVKEVPMELERETTPLGVTAKVVQLEEETIITETEEEIVEEIPPEDTVPDEVTLTLEPELPEEYDQIVAKPVEETPAAPVTEPQSSPAEEVEVTMTPAAVEPEPEKEAPVEQVVSIKTDSAAAQIIDSNETSKSTVVNGEVKGEETKEEVTNDVHERVKKEMKEGVKQEVKEEVNEKVKEAVKEEMKEEVKDVKSTKSDQASKKSDTKTSKKVDKAPAPVEKKGGPTTNKFGLKSKAPAGSPKKKRLW